MPSNEYSIGPRISIKGSAEFKKSIKEINAEYRSLRAEMGLVQQQFKGQETSEKSLAAQKANLTRQIELQEKKISETTEILEKYQASTKATTENVSKYNEMIARSKTDLERLKQELADVNKAIEQSNSKWAQFQQKMGEVSEKTGKIGKDLSSVGGTLTKNVTAPIVALGGAAVAAAKEVNGGMNTIIKMTGATGREAKSLETAYKNAAKNVAGSMEDIASAVGSVNQRFGFTGKQAEKAAEQFMKFSKVTGTDVNDAVRLVSRAMGDANIPAKDYKKILDQLTVASQKTGVSVEDLTQNITKYGAPMRQLGFNTSQTIAMFAQWEKAGVTTEKAFSGMRIAISGWMKEGKDAGTEFQKTVKGIQDGSISTAEAMEIFGKKGGPDMIDAIKQGRFNFDEFAKTLDSTTGSLNKTYNASLGTTDKLQIQMNKLKVAAAGSGTVILKSLLPALTKVMDAAADGAEAFSKLPEGVQTTVIEFAAVAAATGPVISGVGGVFKSISTLTGAFKEGGIAATALSKIFPSLASSTSVATTSLEGTAAAAEGAAAGATGLSTGLGSVAAATGPLALAVGIAAMTIKGYNDAQKEADQQLGGLKAKTDNLVSSTNQLISANNQARETYKNSVADAQANAATAESLNSTLQNLVQTQGNTASGQERIKAVVDQLNQVVPNLNLQYDTQKNTLSLTNDQIKQHIDNMVKEAQTAAQVEMLTEAYKRQYQEQQKLSQIEAQLDSNQSKINSLTERYKDLMNDGGYARHAKELGDIKTKISQLNDSDDRLIQKHSSLDKSLQSNRREARATELQMNGSAKSYKEAFKQASKEIKKTPAEAKQTAKYTKKGFEEGINPGAWAISAKQAAGNWLASLKKALHIKSPSRETMAIADYVVQGFDIGLDMSSWSRMGEQTGQNYLTGLTATLKSNNVSTAAKNVTPSLPAATVQTAKADTASAAASGTKQQTTQFAQNGTQSVKAYTAAITAQKNTATTTGRNLAQSTNTGLVSLQGTLRSTGSALAKQTNAGLISQQGTLRSTGSTLTQQTNAGARTQLPMFTTTGRNAGQNVVTGLRGEIGQARNAGRDTGLGYNNGLKAEQKTVVGTTNDLVGAVKSAFKKGLGIASPSKVAFEYGRYTGIGFINGLNSTELGKFTRSTVSDMKGAFAKQKFSAEANVNYMDDDSMKEVTWMRKYDGGSVVKGADGGKGGRFVSTMLGLVNDDSHGYSQANRWGPDFDCSSSIIYSLKKAGFDTGSASTTADIIPQLTARGWNKLPYKDPKKGDILWKNGHVELSLGNGKNAGFHSAHGHPETGDQAHEAYVGRDPGGWAAILRWKGGFGESLADAIEEAYNFKKYGYGSLDAAGDISQWVKGKVNGNLASWINEAIKITKIPQSNFAGLYRMAMDESRGNPHAIQNAAVKDINMAHGNPARGLMQMIPQTFNAYKMKGHGNIYDPVDNLIASIRYQLARYHRIVGHAGYAVGSRYIPQTMPAIVHQGEMIVPRSENPYANSGGSITGGLVDRIASAVAGKSAAEPMQITMNIYGAEGQDVDELAEVVVDKIIETSYRKAAMV